MSANARIVDLGERADSPILQPTDIVFNFDAAPPMSKAMRERNMAVKLLAGKSAGRSPRLSLRGQVTSSSYAINSSQGSLASVRSRPRSLSDDRQPRLRPEVVVGDAGANKTTATAREEEEDEEAFETVALLGKNWKTAVFLYKELSLNITVISFGICNCYKHRPKNVYTKNTVVVYRYLTVIFSFIVKKGIFNAKTVSNINNLLVQNRYSGPL